MKKNNNANEWFKYYPFKEDERVYYKEFDNFKDFGKYVLDDLEEAIYSSEDFDEIVRLFKDYSKYMDKIKIEDNSTIIFKQFDGDDFLDSEIFLVTKAN